MTHFDREERRLGARAAQAVGVLLVFLLAFIAEAATYEVTVAHPTKYADGSSIPASGNGALTSFRVEYGSCAGAAFGTAQGQKSTPMPANKVLLPNVQSGVVCFRAVWSNDYGQSEPSAVVVAGPAPAAGSIVIVTVTP